MSGSIIEGQEYTSSIHDDQLNQEIKDYNYHSDIHQDEKLYHEEMMERYLITPHTIMSIPVPEMRLSTNYNKIESFAISQIDTSNVKYFAALFNKLAEEAKLSNYKLIFSGLEEVTDHVVIFNYVQQEILDQLHAIQKTSSESIHQQVIRITV